MGERTEAGSSESRQRFFLGVALLLYGLLRSTMQVPDPHLHGSGEEAIVAWAHLGLGLTALLAGACLLRVWRRDQRILLDTYERRGEVLRSIRTLVEQVESLRGALGTGTAAEIDTWLATVLHPAARLVAISAEEGELVAGVARARLEEAHLELRGARVAVLESDLELADHCLGKSRVELEEAARELHHLID